MSLLSRPPSPSVPLLPLSSSSSAPSSPSNFTRRRSTQPSTTPDYSPRTDDYADKDELDGELEATERWLVEREGPSRRRLPVKRVVYIAAGLALLLVLVVSTRHPRATDALGRAKGWVAGGFFGSHEEEEWVRPAHVERTGNVSLEQYLVDIGFSRFPLSPDERGAPLSSLASNASSPLSPPPPSYDPASNRNVVLLTLATAKYLPPVHAWALRARELDLGGKDARADENVVVLCLDEECLDEAERRGLRAYGGYRESVYGERVPPIGVGQEAPLRRRAVLDKREGAQGGLERGHFMAYVKFRALWEINRAGFASLFFEADTILTADPFQWMRPMSLSRGDVERAVTATVNSVRNSSVANLTVDNSKLSPLQQQRRLIPSNFSRSILRPSSTSPLPSANASTLVDPGFDLIFTHDGHHLANFGWILARPTAPTISFWRECLDWFVDLGGWDQGVVTEVIRQRGGREEWRDAWWDEAGDGEGRAKEQWFVVDGLEGLTENEVARVAILPREKFFSYHQMTLGWYQPPLDTPSPVMHHLTSVLYSTRQFYPKERGWVPSLDGYYTRPRPILLPINSSFTPSSSLSPSSLAPFLSTPTGDVENSVWTGSKDEILQYARVLQLLTAVEAGADGPGNGTSAEWSVVVPGKVRIVADEGEEVFERDFSRVVNIDAAIHADLPLLEPAFFTHASRYASPAVLSAWRSTSTTLHVDLASFTSLESAVAHLSSLLGGMENEAVTVELDGWERVKEWDSTTAGSLRRGDVSRQDWDAITQARRCREWEKEGMPFLWCTPEELAQRVRL
ncbi:hypothetical protein NBRC10512_001429 [Rhodotorula toruloides]|uniref:RHTO0S29e00100g1_1 n=2 Tax=Rhodotorula toruloides TaxID=5286 RepID=A0A061BI03_RHOTO|nr:protein of Nucleotide-diphospho-sugar transferase, predicted family [Rhodotorula toruloides NP11]EMS18349.1 protein of Nucleotide-diphospho-sugar transferase, predicted family [Rhodotorula toruloides NP11]CDR49622.1 RHTO0S29e00100g1_1 [Rhodotorula toruloides]